MEQLRKITQDGQRAVKRRKQAEKGLDILTMQAANLKTVKVVGGFRITANNVIPELKRGRVDSPPGLVVSCSTYHGTKLIEFDWFRGVADSSKDMKIMDYLLKYYTLTGQGVGTFFLALLDGQPEEQILEAFPYMNITSSWVLRNASYYDMVPVGHLGPESYLYPDDWPHCSVSPQANESFWVTFAATDVIYEETINACTDHETFLNGYNSDGGKLNARRTFHEQVLWSYRPTAITFNLPYSDAFSTLRPVTYTYYPFQGDNRYYATYFRREDQISSYQRILLENILPDPADPPETHTGDIMPEPLRGYVLEDEECTCRPHGFYAFSNEVDRKPILLNVIDLTNTDNDLNNDGPDVEWFQSNSTQRKWKLSVHWNDLETGDTWSYTSAQFWSLLESKAINSTLGSDWETASNSTEGAVGWNAARAMLFQLFGRPNHSFAVPHDTVTFHAEDNNIYTWTRDYGIFQITRTGIFNFDSVDFAIPSLVSSIPGIRPTIRYSGLFLDDIETEYGRYLCICEDLEEPKKVHGIFSGSPFGTVGWTQLPELDEEETGHISHVRSVYHKQEEDGSESIMLIAILRRIEIIEEIEVPVFFTANLVYNSEKEGNKWVISGRIPNIEVEDPVYGERASWDLCLFGDSALSPMMGKYLSPPPAMSQTPCGPYDGYESGLP